VATAGGCEVWSPDGLFSRRLQHRDEADYLPVALTGAEKVRLANTFPDAVCD